MLSLFHKSFLQFLGSFLENLRAICKLCHPHQHTC